LILLAAFFAREGRRAALSDGLRAGATLTLSPGRVSTRAVV